MIAIKKMLIHNTLIGASLRIRTPGLLVRSQTLYPAELMTHGAGEGNRTLATSLEGWGSTTELHPHVDTNSLYTKK